MKFNSSSTCAENAIHLISGYEVLIEAMMSSLGINSSAILPLLLLIFPDDFFTVKSDTAAVINIASVLLIFSKILFFKSLEL